MALGQVGGFPVVSKVGAGSVLSGKGLTTALGLSNPLSAGLSVLSALGSLGGADTPNISSAATNANSGFGVFAPVNKVIKNKPMIDFGEPLQVITLAIAAVFVVLIIKKVK